MVPHEAIWHDHLDSLISWATGEWPDDSINIVALKDGRFFVVVDYGDRYDCFEEIFRHDLIPYRAPRFFDSEQSVREFAVSCIKQVHPQLKDKDLLEFFGEDDA